MSGSAGCESLIDAIFLKDEALFRAALAEGVNPNCRDKEHRATPLHYAAEQRQIEISRILIEAGADVGARDEVRDLASPLHYAARAGSEEIARMLIEAGADVNARDFYGVTPLMSAERWGQRQVIEPLVRGGADIHATDDGGLNVMSQAVMGAHLQIIELLIAIGVSPSDGPEGFRPVDLAVQSGYVGPCQAPAGSRRAAEPLDG